MADGYWPDMKVGSSLMAELIIQPAKPTTPEMMATATTNPTLAPHISRSIFTSFFEFSLCPFGKMVNSLVKCRDGL